MRYLNGALFVIMILFAAVQYNDPDTWFWIPVYLVPALWCAAAAWRPRLLVGRLPSLGLGVCIALAVGLTAMFWPTDQGWWHEEVWWRSETAREGMGLMIASAALLAVLVSWLRARSQARAAA